MGKSFGLLNSANRFLCHTLSEGRQIKPSYFVLGVFDKRVTLLLALKTGIFTNHSAFFILYCLYFLGNVFPSACDEICSIEQSDAIEEANPLVS